MTKVREKLEAGPLAPVIDTLSGARALGPSGTAQALKVLKQRGLLQPYRPDKLAKAAAALGRYGVSPAGGYAAQAALRADALALVDDEGSLTWAELNARTDAIAGALHEKGITPDSKVALLARNGRGWVESLIALSKIGAGIIHLNTGFAGPQAGDVLDRENATALFADSEFDETIGLAGDRTVIVTHGESGGHTTLASLVDSGKPAPPPPSSPSSQVILTSGTTGAPKGTNRSDAGLFDAVAVLSRIPMPAAGTTVIACPLFHTWGFAHLSLALMLGSTVVVSRRFDAKQTLQQVADNGAQTLVVVPVMLNRMLDVPEGERPATPSLKIVAASGSALSPALEKRFREAFGPVVYNTYGSTEVAYAAIATPEDMAEAPGTVGRPPLGSTVKLLDDDEQEVGPGQNGRIFVGNSMTFGGYTSGEDKDRVGDLVASGDIGRFDEAGRLFVEGRDDDMVVIGGENVFPGEVEDVVMEHEGVAEAAVVSEDDEEWGARLVAHVVKDDGADVDADAIQSHVKSKLAKFKVPREVVFHDELPRNATGKVLKRELKNG